MRIADRHLGPGHEPYVIAELGVNHDGSVDKAVALVEAAARAGVDAIKLQLFRAEWLMGSAARLAAYQAAAGERDPVEMLRRLELSVHQMGPVVQRARARGLHALVTVFSLPLVVEAELLPWDGYKTASPDIVHRPLLEALARTGKPVVISTGAAELAEVGRALAWLDEAGAGPDRTAVLQCVSAYPTPRESAELGGIASLCAIWPGVVGYSDHTAETDTGGLAVGLGATVLEKHLTLDRTASGPDHAASLDEAGMAEYVRQARQAAAALRAGEGLNRPTEPLPGKRVLDRERDVRAVSRQSITTTRDLPAGHVLRAEDVTFKRPGTGLLPFELPRALGRPLARAIAADMPIMAEDLA
jgi:N,N'-diacetyllegionaminate synthase